ncbi:MAG TPA: site-specific DNA-methyltransferase [Anaerolineales bacterium]|nr:site-specific DNA-methyltransferase [Anaerolineales bacterium]
MTRRKTSSSPFGSPGRVSHDSSPFYKARMYGDLEPEERRPGPENPVPPTAVDRIFPESSEDMAVLPAGCIQLMVTSPPYNAGKEYDEDLTLDEYRAFLRRVFAETYRVLSPGGRACVNVANLGRKPYLPLHAFIVQDMLDLGFRMRGEIIWDKGGSASASTAWGSWRSASNPVLRDVHEYVLVFSKETFSRPSEGRNSTITRDDFLEWTKSVWTFPAASARKIGHPAPFPEELPRRLIELYTFKGDVVLDPFAGSGTTCVAARRLGRHFVGFEIHREYVELAEKRLGALDRPATRRRSGGAKAKPATARKKTPRPKSR